MSILRILIADDHDFIRKALRSVLAKHAGWEVCGEAVDGWDAVEKAKSLRPDVVVLDVRMPKLSGLEATPLIKKELPSAIILVLSQLNPGQMLPLALISGADGFASKDRAEHELVSAIERILGRENSFDALAGPPELTSSLGQQAGNDKNNVDCLAGGGEMGMLMRSLDWSMTPIGPVSSWSPSLCMMVRLLLANRFQLLLWWGPQFCQLYNDPFRPSLGAKHPESMGQPAHECWPEIWSIIGPLIDTPFKGGPATWIEDLTLELNRHGFLDEAHFTVAFSPVPDDTVASRIGGVLATVHEITGKVVGDRRVAVLRDLGAHSADAKTAEDACKIAAEALAYHAKDISFALLYLIQPDRERVRGGTALEQACFLDLPEKRGEVAALATLLGRGKRNGLSHRFLISLRWGGLGEQPGPGYAINPVRRGARTHECYYPGSAGSRGPEESRPNTTEEELSLRHDGGCRAGTGLRQVLGRNGRER